ncbi:MAG TPA: Tm-1-like ATP-binding domain-containing protein, partial [Ardenticatenaceae bacterium]|nr:Tm-1-like ATP-binding domain-containing protein [Ardenticatenaceae bacterium]
MSSVFVFATLDTKGSEADFVRAQLVSWGIAVTLVDVGALNAPAVAADVSRDRIFELAGTTLATIRERADRGEAVT